MFDIKSNDFFVIGDDDDYEEEKEEDQVEVEEMIM